MFVTQRCSLANARRLKRAKGSAVRPSEIKTRLILTEGDEVVLDDLEQNMTPVKCKDYLPLCPFITPICTFVFRVKKRVICRVATFKGTLRAQVLFHPWQWPGVQKVQFWNYGLLSRIIVWKGEAYFCNFHSCPPGTMRRTKRTGPRADWS